MTRPRLLDLFCGAGGAAMGYHRAGFDVVGVDVAPQPHYPFQFVQADALEYVASRGRDFDAIHASPPCQSYSLGTRAGKVGAPRLIEATRAGLVESQRPWIIENVYGAHRGRELRAGLLLCGSMFGLAVERHRLFESSLYLWAPAPHDCRAVIANRARYPMPPAWADLAGVEVSRAYGVTGHSRRAGCPAFWRDLMDMPWAIGPVRELTEAIPPVYTEAIGRQLLVAGLAA